MVRLFPTRVEAMESLQNPFPLTTQMMAEITERQSGPIPSAESIVHAVRASGASIRVEFDSWCWWEYRTFNWETSQWEEWVREIECPRIFLTALQEWYPRNFVLRYWVRHRHHEIIAMMLGAGCW